MLKIRLQRIGRKNQPHFRAVITDSRNATKSGKFIEVVGSYNPKAGLITIDKDRVLYWIGKGALPSDTMHNFLISEKIIEGKKRNVLPKKTYVKPVEEKAPEPASAPVAETPKEETVPAPEVVEEPVAETPAPEVKEEAPSETPAEESKAEEAPVA